MDWSGMLSEVLAIVAQKHIVFYEDYHSFAGVCKSWHSAAIEAAKKHKFPNGPPSRFPSLMLSQRSKDKEFPELLLLSNSNIDKKNIRKIELPQIYDKAFMIPCGWLVNVGEDHASQLIHPLSLETINLPKVETIDPDECSTWHLGIQKLILLTNYNQSSSVLPLIVVFWGMRRQLGFCQPGDSKWTHVVPWDWSPLIYDFTYYNGKVYCFDIENHIRAWDVQVKGPTILVDVSLMPMDLYTEPGHLHEALYLIGLDDDERKRLLVVIKKTQIDENGDKTKRFLVFAYDLEIKEWSKVKDFGTKSLFVGDASFWIEEDTTGVIKVNCIYFTDDISYVYGYKTDGKVGDMGIYHMSDETIEPHFPDESLDRVTPQMWLQSM